MVDRVGDPTLLADLYVSLLKNVLGDVWEQGEGRGCVDVRGGDVQLGRGRGVGGAGGAEYVQVQGIPSRLRGYQTATDARAPASLPPQPGEMKRKERRMLECLDEGSWPEVLRRVVLNRAGARGRPGNSSKERKKE